MVSKTQCMNLVYTYKENKMRFKYFVCDQCRYLPPGATANSGSNNIVLMNSKHQVACSNQWCKSVVLFSGPEHLRHPVDLSF